MERKVIKNVWVTKVACFSGNGGSMLETCFSPWQQLTWGRSDLLHILNVLTVTPSYLYTY